MLVVVMEDQLLSPHQICATCLLANEGGQPRWEHGKLRCGQAITNLSQQIPNNTSVRWASALLKLSREEFQQSQPRSERIKICYRKTMWRFEIFALLCHVDLVD